MNTERICGTGNQCEETCPVMRLGRVCPTPAEFIDELLAMSETPEGSPQLACSIA